MTNKTFKLLTDKMSRPPAEYIGVEGDVFLDPTTTTLRVADGLVPGGNSIGIQDIPELVDPARTSYEQSVSNWYSMLSNETKHAGHKWFTWDVNGENADEYSQLLTTWWNIQQVPSSPPTPSNLLPMNPPISSAYYNQLRTALSAIITQYANYRSAVSKKQITGESLTVPEVINTTIEEDLTINIVYTVPGSGSGSQPVTYTRAFVFKTNGTLLLPDGSRAISATTLKNIAASSSDFNAFKAAVAAL